MALSVDDIVAKFPTDPLPKIDGEPTYATINLLTKCVYGNAATLPTTLGRGNLGHIGFVMRPGLYATISPVPFVMPPNPGPLWHLFHMALLLQPANKCGMTTRKNIVFTTTV